MKPGGKNDYEKAGRVGKPLVSASVLFLPIYHESKALAQKARALPWFLWSEWCLSNAAILVASIQHCVLYRVDGNKNLCPIYPLSCI